MDTMADVILKPGREKSLIRHHPWVFSGAVREVRGKPAVGETVEIVSSEGQWLARGAFSPQSQIRVRAWTFNPEEATGPVFFRNRLINALEVRGLLRLGKDTDCLRLVNSESDGLPGLIVDRYADFLVCQFLTAGAELFRPVIVAELEKLVPCAGIFERSDVDVRLKEGLASRTGCVTGSEPGDQVLVREGGCKFLVDVKHGHKTGFYLDQRDNRACLARYAQDREVLNCFSYTGAFGVAALKGGASGVVNVDSSRPALDLARKNVEINGFSPMQVKNVEGDVFSLLRQYRNLGRLFDIVVLDPPRFVDSRSSLMRASRGYKDINLLAFKLIKPGGLLFTFSCSGLMERDLFQKIVADAALDAGREARIMNGLTQSADHVIALNFPEAGYLKGLVCSVW
jgi:23S rRNA (cytosine1962-C5)-methyltransferase